MSEVLHVPGQYEGDYKDGRYLNRCVMEDCKHLFWGPKRALVCAKCEEPSDGRTSSQ